MLTAFLGLPGCLGSSRTLPPLPTGAVIVAFGDSLTFGTGAAHHQSYPSVLAQLTGRRVVNAGVPGEVSRSGRGRLPRVVERERPDLVVICHGGNDILRRHDRVALADNLRGMLEYLATQNIPAIILGVPEPGIFLSTVDLYHTIADEYDVPIEADIVPDLLRDDAFKSDQIHFNAAGYRRMAEAVDAVLRRHGAL